MNMGQLLRNIFHHEVPPDPPSSRTQDESELRWAESKIQAQLRRAQELDIDIDIKIHRGSKQ